MSASFVRTSTLLDDRDTSEAAVEFQTQFIPTMKTLYTNAANTAPERYANVTGWYDWTKYLYLVSVKAQKALEAGNAEEAARNLRLLREHYYLLHDKAGTHKANDFIYEFNRQVNQSEPYVEKLKTAARQVVKAKPMAATRAEKKACKKAVKQWYSGVKKALKDDQLTPEEKQTLEQTSRDLYKAYGMRFE